VHARENLGLRDGFFQNSEADQRKVIQAIRKYRPQVLLCNAVADRHPDHGRSAALVRDAAFLSGLARIETQDADGQPQEAWRPRRVFHYIQDRLMMPHFVVDITPYFELKMKSILAYGSQFYQPGASGPQTYISGEGFLKFQEARNREIGHLVGAEFGEGFLSDTPLRGDGLMGL
jgi:bacillithiol biosynthesis deacetylase BshB1